MTFDNMNSLNIAASKIRELEPAISCEVLDEFGCPRIRIDGDDVVWNSTLYDRGVIKLLNILAKNGYYPILEMRKDDYICSVVVNGETVSSGSCTAGVAAIGAFYAIFALEN